MARRSELRSKVSRSVPGRTCLRTHRLLDGRQPRLRQSLPVRRAGRLLPECFARGNGRENPSRRRRPETLIERPRVRRRLQLLRRWSRDEQDDEQALACNACPRSADGAGARGRASVALGAVVSIAAKTGCSGQTPKERVNKAVVDSGSERARVGDAEPMPGEDDAPNPTTHPAQAYAMWAVATPLGTSEWAPPQSSGIWARQS